MLSGLVLTATLAVANAPSTIPAWSKINSVLKSGLDSTKVQRGDDFELLVDDPSYPQLQGATIVGHVTSVEQPSSGLEARARVGFHMDYVRFKDGRREPVRAEILSQYVTQKSSKAARQEAVKFSLPPMPATHTPGPILWQMNISGSGVSVSPPPSGATSGYVYAKNSNESIVIPPGSQVTIQLTSNLASP
jgi:hypothetical protein